VHKARWFGGGLDHQFVVYEPPGVGDAARRIIILKNDSWQAGGYWVTVQTHWRNTWLHDYTVTADNVKTDSDGRCESV